MKRLLLTCRTREIPDRTHPSLWLQAGGDVYKVLSAAFAQLSRTAAEFEPRSTSFAIRLLVNPVPGCPHCGDWAGNLVEKEGIKLSPDDVAAYDNSGET